MITSRLMLASVSLLLTSGHIAAQETPRGTHLPITRITNSEHSRFTDQARIVVRDSILWRAVWTRVAQSPGEAPPSVDFHRDVVIAAALGGQRAGCCAIHIDSVVVGWVEVTAYVRSGHAGEGCIVTLGFTEPVDVVRVPATSHPVVFAEHKVVGPSCLVTPKG